MPNNTDKLIRLAVKGIIKTLYPNAQIYAWNALSHNIGEWAGMFRTTDGKTHGWIIKRSRTSGERRNAQRDKKTFAYDVWGFYGFSTGNENVNSDNDFADVTDSIYEAVKAAHNLGLPGTVEYHELLQFPAITTLESGEETLHFAQGRLVVHLCC